MFTNSHTIYYHKLRYSIAVTNPSILRCLYFSKLHTPRGSNQLISLQSNPFVEFVSFAPHWIVSKEMVFLEFANSKKHLSNLLETSLDVAGCALECWVPLFSFRTGGLYRYVYIVILIFISDWKSLLWENLMSQFYWVELRGRNWRHLIEEIDTTNNCCKNVYVSLYTYTRVCDLKE